MKDKLTILGEKVTKFVRLETFTVPLEVRDVTCTSDEVTALCPVTGQPDWYIVEIFYNPDRLCVESKSLKLFLQSFRNQGHFCEQFSHIICQALGDVLRPRFLSVKVSQKPRGGIAIVAISKYCETPKPEKPTLV